MDDTTKCINIEFNLYAPYNIANSITIFMLTSLNTTTNDVKNEIKQIGKLKKIIKISVESGNKLNINPGNYFFITFEYLGINYDRLHELYCKNGINFLYIILH